MVKEGEKYGKHTVNIGDMPHDMDIPHFTYFFVGGHLIQVNIYSSF